MSGFSSVQVPLFFLSDHVFLAMVDYEASHSFQGTVVRTVGIIHIGPLAMSVARYSLSASETRE